MQGPSCLGAAVALKECAGEEPFTLVVYGTPAEETLGSKCDMIKNGCFHELDAAFYDAWKPDYLYRCKVPGRPVL